MIIHKIPEGRVYELVPPVFFYAIITNPKACHLSAKNAVKFPRFPRDARWENKNSGLQHVQIPGICIFSSRTPACRKFCLQASQRFS